MPWLAAQGQPTAPALVCDAAIPGSGKTLCAVGLARLLGESEAVQPPPQTPDEWRKNITAWAAAGRTVVIYDNVAGRLDAAPLAALLTAATEAGRKRQFGKRLAQMVDVVLDGWRLTPAGHARSGVTRYRLIRTTRRPPNPIRPPPPAADAGGAAPDPEAWAADLVDHLEDAP